MNLFDSIHTLPVWLSVLLAVTAIFAVLALVNHAVARLAERRHPPAGAFIKVDGVRLHYSDRARGVPSSYCTATLLPGTTTTRVASPRGWSADAGSSSSTAQASGIASAPAGSSGQRPNRRT